MHEALHDEDSLRFALSRKQEGCCRTPCTSAPPHLGPAVVWFFGWPLRNASRDISGGIPVRGDPKNVRATSANHPPFVPPYLKSSRQSFPTVLRILLNGRDILFASQKGEDKLLNGFVELQGSLLHFHMHYNVILQAGSSLRRGAPWACMRKSCG